MRFERQQLVIIIAVFAMVAVFAILQYRPLRSQARAVEQVKAAQLSASAKIESQTRKLTFMRTQLSQAQEKVGNFDSKIPDERMLGAFLQEIADMMNRHNLVEQVVQPDSEIQIADIACIPVRIQGKGTLQQIFEFFRSLQTVERLIRIEQVQLKNEDDLSGMVTMAVRGNIYYKMSGSQNTRQSAK